jgi:hypothetical protein
MEWKTHLYPPFEIPRNFHAEERGKRSSVFILILPPELAAFIFNDVIRVLFQNRIAF